jgi:hypothetical protein
MKLVFALAAMMALPAAAEAAPEYALATLCQVLQPCQPPAQFASGPYLAPPVILEVTLDEIQAACDNGHRALIGKGQAAAPAFMGCAAFVGSGCVVHVPADVKLAVPELYDLILAHELAHCRGWVHADYDTAGLQ